MRRNSVCHCDDISVPNFMKGLGHFPCFVTPIGNVTLLVGTNSPGLAPLTSRTLPQMTSTHALPHRKRPEPDRGVVTNAGTPNLTGIASDLP